MERFLLIRSFSRNCPGAKLLVRWNLSGATVARSVFRRPSSSPEGMVRKACFQRVVLADIAQVGSANPDKPLAVPVQEGGVARQCRGHGLRAAKSGIQRIEKALG